MTALTSFRDTCSAAASRASARILSLLLRPTPPPTTLGLVVAAFLIAAETLLLYPLKQAVPSDLVLVVYLFGVMAIAIVWRFWLTVAVSVASVLAFDYFHTPPLYQITLNTAADRTAVVTFLAVGLLTGILATLARSRAAAADRAAARAGVLAEQQAALRRVATLVAQNASPSQLFAAVAEEMARCLGMDNAAVFRYEADSSAILMAASHRPGSRFLTVGQRINLDGDSISGTVLRTGRPARMDTQSVTASSARAIMREMGIRAAVGSPITVDGRIWGLAIVATYRAEPPPPNTEARIGDFADLLATALANAATRDELQASRDDLSELAAQQAALRRAATVIARGVSPSEVFAAVAEEVAHCLHVEVAGVMRYEADGAATIVSGHFESAIQQPSLVGSRWSLEGDNVPAMILRTGRAARMDTFDNADGALAAGFREAGLRCAVAVPIVINETVWGLAGVASSEPGPLPVDTEARLSDFADLIVTAIANAATRDELIASRARIVAAADDARRRLERDLHDGAQQRLVSTGLQLHLAEGSVPPEMQSLKEQLSRAKGELTDVLNDLQEISRGIHPAILSQGGLGLALKTLARRCPVPVNLDFAVKERLPDAVEVAAYYLVAEALTNTAKYAEASEVKIRAETNGADLCLSIQDDGIGGADVRKGSGLIGIKDRVEVLGGHMQITSHPGSGTALHVTIPVPD